MSQKEIEIINNLLQPPQYQKTESNYEIELRFGNFKYEFNKSSFNSNVGYEDFVILKSYFEKNFTLTKEPLIEKFERDLRMKLPNNPQVYNTNSYNEPVQIGPKTVYFNIRENWIESSNLKIYSKKRVLLHRDIYDNCVRLSKSYEEPFRTTPFNTTDKPMLRRKQRWSFITNNEKSPFYRFRIDLTIVNDTIYEVEVELKDSNSVNFNTLKPILDIINELRQGCFSSIIDNFNKLLNVTLYGKIYDADVKPLNIKLDTLLNDITNLSITDKADGFRKFLFIYENNSYLLYPPYSIQRFVSNTLPNNTIFDGEYIENYGYLIFDVLVLDSINMRELPFTERVLKLKGLQFENPVMLKDFKTPKNITEFYNATNEILDSIKNKEYNNDGLIFNDVRDIYDSSSRIYKWKPVEQLTIDFKLVEKDESEFYLGVIDEYTNSITPFRNFTIQKSDLLKFVNDKKLPLKSIEKDKIIECSYSTKWNMVRSRPDRTNPNRSTVAESIYRDIINPITENTIRGKGLQLMRRLTNIVKEEMLRDTGDVLLDIGSGRGGDISKWLKLRKTVYAVEPDLNNLEEMKNRLENWSFSDNVYTKGSSTIHILNTGGEDSKTIEKLNANTVVIFNALTFFFKNEKLLDSLIRTIDVSKADSLIGIVMDGDKIVKNMSYDSWSIEFGESSNKMFGRDIVIDIEDSIVRNQTEYLVDFDIFVEKLKGIGFKLEKTEFLDYPDKLPEESNALSRLYRNFVFRKVERVTKTVKIPTQKDKFLFYSKSVDDPPGEGKIGKSLSENKNTNDSYAELEKIKDWRKVLSNFYVCEKPFEFDGKHFNSAEHAFHYAKFKTTGHIDKANSFTVESSSKIGLEKKEIENVKSYGGKGKMGLKLNTDEIIKWEKARTKSLSDILLAKFTQCAKAREVLLATKDAELYHSVIKRGEPAHEEHWDYLEEIRSLLRKPSISTKELFNTIFETVPDEQESVEEKALNLLDALLKMGLQFKDIKSSEELLKYIVRQFKKRWDLIQYTKLRERYGDFKNAKESLKKQKNWKPLRLLLEVSNILGVSIKIDDVQYGDYDIVYRLQSDGLRFRIVN
jgi:predicted NAD-dependent protein-ADP-ribosyltransferase YbiA (DUF1768 family)